jgi:flagellin-like hook-associated protein FlgL
MAISLSSGVRQALSSLQSTASQQSVIQNRLATGNKVNSALDNPSSFFTASGLNNRAGDLSRLLDDMGQAVKTIEAADKGMKAITKLVESAQGTLRQALQSAQATETTQVKGDLAAGTLAASDELVADLDFEAGDEISVTVGSGSAVDIAIEASDTVSTLVGKINDNATLKAAGVTAEFKDGNISINGPAAETLTVAFADLGGAGTDGAIADLFGTADLTPAAGNALTESASRKDLAAQFNETLKQIDTIAKDAGYNGVNLLNGDDLTVQFNEDNTSTLAIKGVTMSSADDLGVSSATVADTSTADNNFQTNAQIKTLQGQLDEALTTLRTQASKFGSNLAVVQTRQDFTKGMVDTLRNGADALTLADPNEEGASLLALNTRAQLSSTALSLASQADQAVLRLF